MPPGVKSTLIDKNSDLGKIESKRKHGERGWDGWMTSLNGHEFEQTPGDDDEGQGSPAGCSPWGSKGWMRLGGWTTILRSSVNNPMERHVRKNLAYSHCDLLLAGKVNIRRLKDASMMDPFGVEFKCHYEYLYDKQNQDQKWLRPREYKFE